LTCDKALNWSTFNEKNRADPVNIMAPNKTRQVARLNKRILRQPSGIDGIVKSEESTTDSAMGTTTALAGIITSNPIPTTAPTALPARLDA
jgi:hypothetical protein